MTGLDIGKERGYTVQSQALEILPVKCTINCMILYCFFFLATSLLSSLQCQLSISNTYFIFTLSEAINSNVYRDLV